MKKTLAFLLLASVAVFGQVIGQQTQVQTTATDPTGDCRVQAVTLVSSNASNKLFQCNASTGVWGGTPTTFGQGVTGTGLNVLQTSPTLLTPTLTTPTVNNPVISGPAPVACGATCTVATPGAVYLLNQAAGSTATLPTSSGSGSVYKLLITVATTSAQEKVLLTTTTDAIIGTAIGENGGTAKIFVGNASTYHSIQMPFAGTQPSGGFIGDSIICTDIAAGTWACQIVYQAGATPTTPYSASTT